MAMPRFEIVERDEAGKVTTSYLASGGARVDARVDVINASPNPTGVGVGDATATPTTALLLTVLQESTGRLATILFAHRLGTALEPECKQYRLAADVLNDTAMVLDCLSPAFPKPVRVGVLSASSVLRSLCGVCAGSAKASLSAHFARRGNLGEVNAKDSSQETVISLLGMLAGSIVISHMTSPLATWTALLLLLSLHLATNYAAVRAVSMHNLNRQRANIVFSNLFQHGQTLSPTAVSQRERVFERDGVLRWSDDEIVGYCKIGVSLQQLLVCMGGAQRNKRTGSLQLPDGPDQGPSVSELLDTFANEAYILWAGEEVTLIVLKEGCKPIDQLKAWAHALLLAKRARGKRKDALSPSKDCRSGAGLRRSLEHVTAVFGEHVGVLREQGWDLDVAVLETRAGTRACVDVGNRVV
ncbi:DUF647-domain-containing protein [Decorospora gaudefroyi]|uniref:DUF647-domain-containing protein n=1 Tax=Decorospora gaudefroyi TaxID=184978 RepID=A0A6A5KVB1_9PLEO|nr:DUF647-domain-containing protein [Decorospora gaudefroyi]